MASIQSTQIFRINGLLWRLPNIFQHGTVLSRHLSSTSIRWNEIKPQAQVNYAFTVLGVDPECDVKEIKEAYIGLAKKYHPDSGSASADARKFDQVQEAYKIVLANKKSEGLVLEDDTDKYFYDIKHTAPQHRQYLNNQGIGFGTPCERQKQYNSYKVWKAASDIQDHRIQKLSLITENALLAKEKKLSQRAKISNTIERIVEDLIQQSLQKGEFENLTGSGKPLEYDRNPMVDSTTHNLNKILINNGFTPEWITLQADIRREIKDARKKLAVLRKKMTDEPSDDLNKLWDTQLRKHHRAIVEINEMVEKYNNIVPFFYKQFAHFNFDKDVENVCNNLDKFLPSNKEIEDIFEAHFTVHDHGTDHLNVEKVNWGTVWQDIKSVFHIVKI